MNTREATSQYRMSNWKKMFSERVTGENVDEFCTRNGISHSQFFYRQRKLREAACNQIANAVKLSEHKPVKSTTKTKHKFMQNTT